jgi:ferritin
MLNPKVQDAINNQINMEFSSSYAYLSMAAYFEAANLPGFAHWMRMQNHEEIAHAMKFFDYVNDRGGRVILKAIEQPPVDFQSPLDVMQQALKAEQQVTASINRLYGLANQESDYPSQALLNWFVTEQVEEEKNATAIVEQLKLVGDNGTALLLLDRELGARQPETA